MKIIESRLYAALMVLTDYILLGLVWVICSLPVVTIYSATTATFYVMKQWQRGTTGQILKLFFLKFKEKLIRRTGISIAFVSCLWLIQYDFGTLHLTLSFDRWIASGLLLALSVVLLLFIHLALQESGATTATFKEVLKTSALSICYYFPINIGILVLIGLSCFLILLFPLTIFVEPMLVFVLIVKATSKKITRELTYENRD